MMKIIDRFEDAQKLLQEGMILAYPTEAVYGLGCDPFNKDAVEKILTLKRRPTHKGFIILIADWGQLSSLTKAIPIEKLEAVQRTWPGPVTWLFPKSANIPEWLCGEHESVAIRMSTHPIAHKLCKEGPIVSTSANLSGLKPARTLNELEEQFPTGIDAVFAGDLGGANQPSAIYDVLSGQRLR